MPLDRRQAEVYNDPMPSADSIFPRIRLVTRGDDAGSCDSANVAIRQAARHGVLRNVSVMAPGPAFAAAVPLLQSLPGSICLGLHVTLNAEWETVKWPPVLPREQVPSLVDEHGYFWPTPVEAQGRGARVDEMLAEIEAQLARVRGAGLTVGYVDEHMGVSWPWPELRAGIAELAAREGLQDVHSVPGLPPVEGPSAREALLAALDQAAPGAYVHVTHPGWDADDMRRFDGVGQVARWRDADRRLLTDPSLPEALAARGVQVVRYTDL